MTSTTFAAAALPEWNHEAFALQLSRLLDRLDDLLLEQGLVNRKETGFFGRNPVSGAQP